MIAVDTNVLIYACDQADPRRQRRSSRQSSVRSGNSSRPSDGVSALSIKDELLTLEARKAELQSRLDAPEMPELLHPRMADVYHEKVGSLCLALEGEESRTGVAHAIRALVEAIVLEPDGERLKITRKGDLAGMLSAARGSKRSPDTGDLLVQIKLVAGGGFEPPTFGL